MHQENLTGGNLKRVVMEQMINYQVHGGWGNAAGGHTNNDARHPPFGSPIYRMQLDTRMHACIQAHGLKTRDMLRWSIDIASVLAYLHSSSPPIAHRDIKLENASSIGVWMDRK